MRILLFLLLIPTVVVAQVNLKSGLVAYYPFNGNANDESGNNNNPSSVKATFTSDRLGKANSACYFNGKNNFIRIPDNPGLHFKKGFSISAWVMVNGFYEGTCHGNRIIMKGSDDNYNSKTNYTLTFDDNHSTNGGNCYTKKPDKKKQSFYGAFATPVSNDYIVTDKWYLLTYTYDGRNASLYVDCKLQGSGVISDNNFSNNEDLFFGKMDNSQYPYWFNGLLDEVRIYNRALSKSEILTLCDKRPQEQVPAILCTGTNVVPAKFDYTITDCNTATFNLSTSNIKNLKNIQWFFGDGAVSNKLSPIHSYKKMGTYKVKAIVISNLNCADTFTREIRFKELTTDFVYSEQGDPGKIQFKAKNNNASYSWNLGDGNTNQNESIVTHFYNKTGQYTVQLFAQNNAGCRDTVEKRIDIIFPEFITDTDASEPNIPVIVADAQPAVPLERRDKDVIRTIAVENDWVTISLYDNGIIDGDSITLVYNDEIILTHQLLKSKPLTLSLKINPDRSSNELVMYAENLGSIPPNTALMIITDGNNRHEIPVSSNKKSNGVISFTIKR